MFGVSEWFGPELSVDSYKTWQRHKTHSHTSNLTKLMGACWLQIFSLHEALLQTLLKFHLIHFAIVVKQPLLILKYDKYCYHLLKW